LGGRYGVSITNLKLRGLNPEPYWLYFKSINIYGKDFFDYDCERLAKYRRDALSLAHEQLKSDSDSWNKCVIVLSLGTGMFESAKIQMGWNNKIVALVPIALSSVIACISALMKFRNFPSQMEIILQSQSLLTHTLTNARNENSITPVLLKEYNDALEKLETALYPDNRKQYMVQSHRNLISMNTASKLGPHTQTDRGTCPGVGL
jgi:hypothetical protein